MKAGLNILSILSLLLLCSCGTFEKQWKQSVAAYRAGDIRSPEGPWAGTWTTKTNGHTGDLRAIVSEKPGSPGSYKFRYHATWAPFFQGVFNVGYPVTRSGSTYRMKGDHNLGLFGKFQHEGKISGNSFDATYSNDKGELGAFSLHRPE